tara:strand:- start:19 stop:1155 length:1137 start_codon:yes stop_codon:yes gene_type:complete
MVTQPSKQIQKILAKYNIKLKDNVPVVEEVISKKEIKLFRNLPLDLPNIFDERFNKKYSRKPILCIIKKDKKGNIRALSYFKFGEFEGKQYTWRENGQLEHEYNYVNGLLQVEREDIQKILAKYKIKLKDNIPVTERIMSKKSLSDIKFTISFPATINLLDYDGGGSWDMEAWYRVQNYLDYTNYRGIPIAEEEYVIIRYEKGDLFILEHLKNGVIEGKKYTWHKNGQLWCEENYVEGEREGKEYHWYENGKKRAELNFSNGKFHGKFREWYKNGRLIEGNFVYDKQHGLHQEWYKNGQLRLKGNYVNNKEHGLWQEWYANGQLKVKVNYVDGEEHGEEHGLLRTWYADGQLKAQVNYVDGEEVSKKEWDKKGKLIEK